MNDLLLIALKGTIAANCEGDERSILRHAGIGAMRRMGGYIVPTMPVIEVILPPPEADFADVSNCMMMAFLDNFFVPKGNTTASFMLMAWIYIGTDNEFRLAQYIHDKVLIRHIVFMLLRIVCGGSPTKRQLAVTIKYANHLRSRSRHMHLARFEKAVADTIAYTCEIIREAQKFKQSKLSVMGSIVSPVTGFIENAVLAASIYRAKETPRHVKGAIQAQAIKWMTLTEAEQLNIVREWLLLLLDDR